MSIPWPVSSRVYDAVKKNLSKSNLSMDQIYKVVSILKEHASVKEAFALQAQTSERAAAMAIFLRVLEDSDLGSDDIALIRAAYNHYKKNS